NLAAGAASVIARFNPRKPQSLNPAVIFRQKRDHSISNIIASPFFVLKLAAYAKTKNKDAAGISKLYTGGAAVFPDEACLIHYVFKNAVVLYGSTEAEPVSEISAQELCSTQAGMLLPVGKIHPSALVRIISFVPGPVAVSGEAEFETMCLKSGNIGEIVVSGPHVLAGYWNDPEASRENKIVAGSRTWHRTGDAGMLDERGRLWLAGRCKQAIGHSTGVLYPFLFEGYCRTVDGIAAGTLMLHEQIIIAAIECKKHAQRLSLAETLRKSRFPIDKIKFLERIPRDPRHFSKIDYERLRKMLDENV
ncbi:MAG: AMP-binding protein, partial [Bacteroidota bacterium]|nr:AMP-binding protein [Bacteroidota bacterium]